METPSSLRGATMPQASTNTEKAKEEDLNSKSTLSDITNDSPIIGVATENSSIRTPKPSTTKNTPGSGETLLRGQVKSLLQKVEEEAEFLNNNKKLTDVSLEKNGTIQILEPIVQEESIIKRTLLFDSPDDSKSTNNGSSISSPLSYHGSEIRSSVQKSMEDDRSSVWSLQVNVSLKDEDEEETFTDFGEEGKEGDEKYEDDELPNDICDGLSKLRLHQEKVELPGFEGKHTRFVYDSDGEEIKGEQLIVCDKVVSPSAVVLKGLPVPEGKHLRFQDDEGIEN